MFTRISALAFNSAKSRNPIVRTLSVDLFQTVIQKTSDDTHLQLAAIELLSLPKAGKTAGSDHRVALYSMLSFLPPSSAVSTFMIQSIPPLLAKETHDGAMATLATALPAHIVFLLRANQPLSSEAVNLVAKEMNNPKLLVRRAFCSVTGNAIWEYGDLESEASLAFVKATLPSLESNLKNVSVNPPIATSGSIEGYIPLAILLGRLSRSHEFGRYSMCLSASLDRST